MSQEVYLCLKRNVILEHSAITVKDVASTESANSALKLHINQIRIGHINKGESLVFSVLWIIECIHKEYPNISVVPTGETDVIVRMKKNDTPIWIQWLKTIVVSLILFVGAGFSLMTFHNDVGMHDTFDKFYFQITGTSDPGCTVLEISYCIGIVIGVLVFFNHFPGKKVTIEPTPIQVQMRQYEKDVDQTLAENSERKGTEKDAD